MEIDKSELCEFYHEHEGDTIWWTERGHYIDGEWYGDIGEWLFSFDKKKIYSMFIDYPYNMTEEEVEIFNRENPYWADFFRDRFDSTTDNNEEEG